MARVSKYRAAMELSAISENLRTGKVRSKLDMLMASYFEAVMSHIWNLVSPSRDRGGLGIL